MRGVPLVPGGYWFFVMPTRNDGDVRGTEHWSNGGKVVGRLWVRKPDVFDTYVVCD